MAESSKRNIETPRGVDRLREEHKKVVKDCDAQIQHWKKVNGDYDALDQRLKTLPDQLSYDIMVPFGPLAFMPGKLIHTNEVNVLLGDNWFAKCSTKQAQKIVEHRKQHVKTALDDLQKTRANFEARVHFTEDLANRQGGKGDFVDIQEVDNCEESETVTKGKLRVAHQPHSRPRLEALVDLDQKQEDEEEESAGGDAHGDSRRGVLSEEELWSRLDELEKLEEEQDEHDRRAECTDTNRKHSSSSTSSSSEEDKEGEGAGHVNGLCQTQGRKPASYSDRVNGTDGTERINGTARPMDTNKEEEEKEEEDDDDDEDDEGSRLPTIYFSHTMEPKKVRINTGLNKTLKFSERKEQERLQKDKRKKKHSNGNSHHEHFKITSPTDIYRLFVDVKNGERIPRKSILKSRSRENSVCSDTSESSAADFDERRTFMRTQSHDDTTTHSDTSDGITEEESPTGASANRFEAFSGTVVEKDPLPSPVSHLALAPPALPTIPERRLEEVAPEPPQETLKRVSKFKAARLQQK